jgi:hypothetical protein
VTVRMSVCVLCMTERERERERVYEQINIFGHLCLYKKHKLITN